MTGERLASSAARYSLGKIALGELKGRGVSAGEGGEGWGELRAGLGLERCAGVGDLGCL